MLDLLLGILIADIAIASARFLKWQHWYFTAVLIALPLAYGGFALYAGQVDTAAKELVIGVPYLLVGIGLLLKQMRYSAILVGAMWLSHGVFDYIHDYFVINPGVPGWYPALCAGFDLVVGAYVLWLSRSLQNADIRMAKA